MSEVKVIAFLNAFAKKDVQKAYQDEARLDVVVDWGEEWHADDPFEGAQFRLAATPAGVVPLANTNAYDVRLEPLLIEEVREQLVVVGHDTAIPANQVGNIRYLAPSFVKDVAERISGDFAKCVTAKQAKSMAEFVQHETQLFAAPNFFADCARWVKPVLPKLDGAAKAKRATADVAPALRELVDSLKMDVQDLGDVVRDPRTFREMLDKAEEACLSKELTNLEEKLRLASVEEQLVYAEALRRDQVYSRLREGKPAGAAMAGSHSDDELGCDRRADVRRMARDEPVLGAMFHVSRWFAMPQVPVCWDGQWIWVLPFAGETPLAGYGPVPTQVGYVAPGRPVTILRRDRDPSYFARAVTVRQVAPALLLDGEDGDHHGTPKDPIARLKSIVKSRHGCPPISLEMIGGGDPSERLRGEEPKEPLHPAFALNDLAYRPRIGDEASSAEKKELEYLYSDGKRELADAAESIRRTAPPHDVIAISWDRDLTEQAIAEAVPPQSKGEDDTGSPADLHFGFKGYRIDVREVGESGWQSLCTVEREVFDDRQQAVARSRLPRESYVIQPVQNHSREKDEKPTALTLPADFVHWAGGSVVAASPLDRLGEALEPLAINGSLLVVRELGTTGISPRYGRTYEFRIRGVGLSGVGPGAAEAQDHGATDRVEFRRGVPMDAPVVHFDDSVFYDLVPIDVNGKPAAPAKAIPDAPLLATSATARLSLKTSPPLAHWRVALHARGLTQLERATNGGTDFERACARFVTRNRNNWRRRLDGVPVQGAPRPAAHLSALDPHCGAVELVTKAWFPFSSNKNERYIVTGRTVHNRRDIACASFSELVTRGEDSIETEMADGSFEASVSAATLPDGSTCDSQPRILAGFHGTVEVSALWSEDSIRHFPAEEGRKRWTRNLFVGMRPPRPIGGRVRPLAGVFKAGTPAIATNSTFVDASYAGLENVENERELRMPLSEKTKEEACEVSESPPALASPTYWRKLFFDRDCASFPLGAECRKNREIYRRFVAQQLGFPAEMVDFPVPDPSITGVKNPYENRLAVRLGSRLIEQKVSALLWGRSLVAPVFTLPVATTYDPAVELTVPPKVRSVTATIGDFGSLGVAGIRVTSPGAGYLPTDLLEVRIGDGTTSAKARVSQILNGGVQAIEVEDGGRDFEAIPTVTLVGGSGAGAEAVAELGAMHRRLPWVDVDVVWMVRLAWRPFGGNDIERPLELAAVREFALYRKDLRTPACKQAGQAAGDTDDDRPIATLARPGVDVLENVDLDLVEFTWIDGISDREPHEYEYQIVAVPEDSNTFARSVWYTFRVDVPDTRIASRPESMRFLPMLATEGKAGTDRHLALYFSDPIVRSRADHVTLRYARAADDPMLPIHPIASVDEPPAPHTPTGWPDLFPGSRVSVRVVESWEALVRERRGADGHEAPLIETWKASIHGQLGGSSDCMPASEGHRGRVFVAGSSMDGRRLIRPSKKDPCDSRSLVTGEELGNPFFKLHLYVYDDRRFPALAHTAASEPAETDWLQFYPDDLGWKKDLNVLEIASPWGACGAKKDNLIWYRFHFFADATRDFLFHLSTFYSHDPALSIDSARIETIGRAYGKFASQCPTDLRLYVRAEEGLLAPTYSLKDVDKRPTVDPDTPQDLSSFVVLRATQELKEICLDVSQTCCADPLA